MAETSFKNHPTTLNQMLFPVVFFALAQLLVPPLSYAPFEHPKGHLFSPLPCLCFQLLQLSMSLSRLLFLFLGVLAIINCIYFGGFRGRKSEKIEIAKWDTKWGYNLVFVIIFRISFWFHQRWFLLCTREIPTMGYCIGVVMEVETTPVISKGRLVVLEDQMGWILFMEESEKWEEKGVWVL